MPVKRIIFTFFIVHLATYTMAQVRHGIIADYNSNEAIKDVCIINRKNGKHNYSDSLGRFTIEANNYETLLFSSNSTQFFKIIILPNFTSSLDTVFLKKKSKNLKEVEVLSDYLKLKKDSVETYHLYRKFITDAQRKSKTIFIPPLIIYSDGGITELAARLSGRKKKNKKLFNTIKSDYETRYVGLYYNTEKIKKLFSIDDSTANEFIRQFPMPYDFAKATSDLEKSMWIKNLYKKFK